MMPAHPHPDESLRMATLGMEWPEFYRWRRNLRADYARSLASERRPPCTTLSTGMLFPLTDPDAELAVTMCNRAMTSDEWESYRRSPAALRKRRPMTLRERANVEADAGRVSDETMQELARSGEMRVTL